MRISLTTDTGVIEYNTTPPAKEHNNPEGLTPREKAVLRLACAGHTVIETARILRISDRTVHTHLTSAYRKLNVTSRLEAAILCLHSGLVKLEDCVAAIQQRQERAQ